MTLRIKGGILVSGRLTIQDANVLELADGGETFPKAPAMLVGVVWAPKEMLQVWAYHVSSYGSRWRNEVMRQRANREARSLQR